MRKQKEIEGIWHNQHKSQIELSCGLEGQLTGVFKTQSPQGNLEEFELTGYCNKDVVTFCVNFANHGSVTAWVGQLVTEHKVPVLKTLWHMSMEMGKYECDDNRSWKSILSGADTFYRGPVLLSESDNFDTEEYAAFPPWIIPARKTSVK